MTTPLLKLMGERAEAQAELARLTAEVISDTTLFPAWLVTSERLTEIESEIVAMAPQSLGEAMSKVEVLRAHKLNALARKVAKDAGLDKSLSIPVKMKAPAASEMTLATAD